MQQVSAKSSTWNNADQILPRLWLGNKGAALDSTWLREKKITTVFNCTKDIPFAKEVMHQYRVPVDDSTMQEDIQKMTNWSPEIMYKLMAEYILL